MKLFLWEKVLNSHGDGMAFALAETEEQARFLIIDKYKKEYNIPCEPDCRNYINHDENTEGYDCGNFLDFLHDLERKPKIISSHAAWLCPGSD